MKFRSDEDGYITALRFYKQPNNTGTHVGHLWSGSGQLLAAATFTNETASGWQKVTLPNPVPITKDTTYVTSYHASAGRFAFSTGFFNQGVDRAPLHAPRDGLYGGNGVYRYGASELPGPDLQRDQLLGRRHLPSGHPSGYRGPGRGEHPARLGGLRRRGGRRRDRHLRRADRSGLGQRHHVHPAGRRAATSVAAYVTYDAQTRTAKLESSGAARVLRDLHRPPQGRRRRRDRRGRQPAGRRQDLDVHHRHPAAGRGPRRADCRDHRPGRPVRALLRRDPAG